MYSPSKFAEQKSISRNSVYDTTNGLMKSFIQPKITSTPLRRDTNFPTPTKPRLVTNHRYSLSDITTPPKTNSKDSKKTSLYPNCTGPLLASTQFNVSVSTYEDAKSPGLASRIVQYSDEIEREKEYKRPSTHQAKYGSPGLFPVVHLFKKKLPVLEQKPRRVSVRLASPDHSRFQSQEYNRKLLEGIIKPGTSSLGGRSLVQPSSESSPSTRSVLDALKEISRKRIHANEEYDLLEDNGKRLRTEQINGDTNKRLRDDSPLLETSTSPGKPVSKRICVYDEYKASCSSSDFSFPDKETCGSKRKSISISTSTENPKESKLVKLINAETQTVIEASHKSIEIQDKPVQRETPESDILSEEVKQNKNRESPLKIFDDAPLERIRKNRLAALMGSLVGKNAVALTPKPDITAVLDDKSHAAAATVSENIKMLEKPLVSILTRNRSPQKSDKHVHFSIPETSSESTESSIVPSPVDTSAPTSITTTSATTISQPSTSSLSAKILLPTTAVASVSEAAFVSNTSLSSAINKFKDIASSQDTPPLSSTSFTTLNVSVTKSMSTTAIGGSSFGTTTSGFTMPAVPKPLTNISSPPKSGGFKFDLNKPVATTSAVATTTITSTTSSFGNITTKPVTGISSPLLAVNTITSTPLPQPLNTGNFAFSSKNVSGIPNTTSEISITAATTTSSLFGTPISSISTSPSFNFGSNNANKQTDFGSPTTQSSFGTPTTQNSFSVPTTKVNFCTTTTANSFGTPTTQSSFGTSMTHSSFAAPTTQTSFATPTTLSNNAIPTTQTSFAIPSMQSNFGSPNIATSTPQFGSATSTSTGFGSATNTTTGFGSATSTTTGFGSATSTTTGFGSVTSTTTGFRSSKPVFSFGSSVNADKPILGAQTGPTPFSFGAPTTTAITSAPTVTTTPSVFGTATISSSFATLGSSSGFGTTMSSSGFGKPTTTSSFGVSSNSGGFGVSKPGLFVASSTPSFGTNTTTTSSAFANSTNPTTPFGVPNSTGFGTSTAQSPFGAAATTASFGATNTFGSTITTNAAPLFGGKSTSNAFGTSNGGFGTQQQTTPNIFGGTTVNPTPSFGTPNSNSVFGTTAPPPFGSSATTTSTVGFGSNTTPAFTFGAITTTNLFGVTTASSSFGTTSTPTFGNTNSFRGSAATFPASSSFGGVTASSFTPTTSTPSASFGSTNTSNFGASGAGFAASTKPIFGNSTTTAFDANSKSPAFGSATPNSGFGTTNNSLNFGSNTSHSAFTKPQPTANSFGSTSNSFGTSNNFGTNQQQGQTGTGFNSAVSTTPNSVFNFAAAAKQPTAAAAKPPGVFSFGASASGDPPKPNFNFTGGNTAPPTFGSSSGVSSAASYSSTGAPTFGAASAPPFGAPQPATAGVFNIGAGPPTAGRARTQLKAKRRT